MMKTNWLKKKRILLPLVLIVLLISFRVALPYIVKNYVNKTLENIPGYTGNVKDIDISLLRGAYVIQNLYLNKVNANTEVPFLNFKETDISIEWNSLFKGKIVSEIVMKEPQFIYVFEDQQIQGEDAAYDDWTKALTDLVPIDLNRLRIYNGKAAFVQLTAEPNIDLYLNDISLEASNLRNVVRTDENLPSTISATALSIGQGKMTLEGELDIVKQIPDMDVSLSLEKANVRALNNFIRHYAGIDFQEGEFNVYSEVAIADGYLAGYVKPLLKDSKLIGKDDKFLETLWEGFVGFFKFILKNKGNNTLATKVPIKGDLNKVQGKAWPTIFNLVKNGWIKAFVNKTDNEINFKDAVEEKQEN